MGLLERVAIGIVVIGALALGAYLKGWHDGYGVAENAWKVKVAAIELEARRQADALRSEGSRLAAELIEARARVKIEYIEVVRYVTRRARPDRLSVDGAITRMLNESSAIRETVERPAPGAADPDPAPAADSGGPDGTSEKAIVGWIANTLGMYENCRRQANALIDYAKACAR